MLYISLTRTHTSWQYCGIFHTVTQRHASITLKPVTSWPRDQVGLAAHIRHDDVSESVGTRRPKLLLLLLLVRVPCCSYRAKNRITNPVISICGSSQQQQQQQQQQRDYRQSECLMRSCRRRARPRNQRRRNPVCHLRQPVGSSPHKPRSPPPATNFSRDGPDRRCFPGGQRRFLFASTRTEQQQSSSTTRRQPLQ